MSARILLLIPGDPSDGGWSEAASRAIMRASRDGHKVRVEQTLDPDIEDAWDVVVGHGGDYARSLASVAIRYPDTHFIVSDDIPDRSMSTIENLSFIDWRWDEGSFIAGVLAAHMSRTATVGFLGGAICATQLRNLAGFRNGVTSVTSERTVVGVYCGTFGDSARAHRLAEGLIAEGADVVFHTADSSGVGAIEAVADRGVMAIGFMNGDDRNHECTIGFLSSDVEGALYSAISQIAVSKHLPQLLSYGLGSGFQEFIVGQSVPARVRTLVEQVRRGMVKGDREAVRRSAGLR